MATKTKNKTWIGLSLLTLGGIYLVKRFSFKVVEQDNQNLTFKVRLVDGLKSYTTSFRLGLNYGKQSVFGKYNLAVDFNSREGLSQVQLSDIKTGKEIAVLNVVFPENTKIEAL